MDEICCNIVPLFDQVIENFDDVSVRSQLKQTKSFLIYGANKWNREIDRYTYNLPTQTRIKIEDNFFVSCNN
jgi:hypothetical protein